MQQLFTYAPRMRGMADVGVQSSDPRFHARNLAERKVPVGPLASDGLSFIADPTDRSDVTADLPDADAWGVDATAEFELVALEFQNGNIEPHELGAPGDTWTVVSDRGRVIRLYRIPAASAQPCGEIAGVCRVVPIMPLPGSRLSDGETFYWATTYSVGQSNLSYLSREWLFALPKASISAARKRGRRIGVSPHSGGDEKRAKTHKRSNFVSGSR